MLRIPGKRRRPQGALDKTVRYTAKKAPEIKPPKSMDRERSDWVKVDAEPFSPFKVVKFSTLLQASPLHPNG